MNAPQKVLIINSTYSNGGLDTVLIAKEFSARNVDVTLLTQFKSTEITARKHGVKTVCIADKIKKFRFHEEDFRKGLEEYGLNFDTFAFDEISKPFQNAKPIMKKFIASLRIVENHLTENSYDCIYNHSHVLLDRIVFHVARKKGILNLHGTATTPYGKMGWGVSWRWDDFIKKEYINQEISQNERKNVIEYIRDIKEHKPLVNDEALILIAKGSGMRILKDAYNHVFVNRRLFENFLFPLSFLRESILSRLRAFSYRKHYREPDYNEKYVYFPFQITTDASIAVFDPEYYRQDMVIEEISKALPEGYKLYVKEHPKGKGNIPKKWMKRVLALPNVKLISVGVSSHDLIQNCQALVVITTFTGWEGIMYFKPVVILGHPPFSRMGVSFDVESMSEIGDLIKKAIECGKIEEERVYRMINASMKSIYNCHIYIMDESDKGNVGRMVDSMLTEYDYFIKKSRGFRV